MKAQLLLLTAAALLCLGSGVQAAPRTPNQVFIENVSAQAAARLVETGVSIPAEVRVRASISGDRLGAVQVIQSSGDFARDVAIEKALTKMRVRQAPAELGGRQIVIKLGAPLVEAKLQADAQPR